jgi:hypothetical protein
MELTLTQPAALTFEGFIPFTSSGTVDGLTANALAGSVTFFGVANVTGLQAPTNVDFPVTFAGLVQGYSANPNCPECDETLLWSVLLEGAGTADFGLTFAGNGEDIFTLGTYQLTGKAEVVQTATPEPASLLLLSAGLLGIGGWRRLTSLARLNATSGRFPKPALERHDHFRHRR